MRYVIATATLLVCLGCDCGKTPADNDGGGGGTGGGAAGGAGGGSGGSGGGVGGGSGGGATGCVAGLTALAVTPAGQTLTVGATPAPVSFTATGTVGGQSVDVTAQLTWTATRQDDTPPGTFSAPGQFRPTAGAGGVVTITATDGCVTASTTVTLKLEVTLVDPGTAVTSRFGGTVVTGSATKTPTWVYPSDLTLFPRNIYKVLFQWRRGGNEWFRLTFDGPSSKTVAYTQGNNATCATAIATAGCWEADLVAWLAIAGSNAGQTTTVTIDAVSAGDANVYRNTPITIGFSRRDVRGAIFYWSTTAAGVRRASVSDRVPEDYVVGKPVGTQLPDAGTVKCVACHTVSRSGRKMVAFTEAASTGEYVYEVTQQAPPIPLLTTQLATRRAFGTFRPDDQRVVATVGSLLSEFDVDGGAKIVDLPLTAGTNPDWSPTGLELAYSDKGGDSPGGANLSVISYDGGAWGTPRVLVAAGGQSNLFPSYSPDGTHLAYARGKGGHGDKTLQLWLARTDGGAPIELVIANRVVNQQTTAGQHENNMPTWAPPGDYDWVAFNSVRPYGVVFPTGGTQQIWVAAIDRTKLAQGIDPSSPAFRFAFQGLTENNHRAFWTLDVRDPADGGADGGSCAPFGGPCSAGSPCCYGSQCISTVEFGNICGVPDPDGGACIADQGVCSQTSGQPCCGFLVCDLVADGGSICRSTIN